MQNNNKNRQQNRKNKTALNQLRLFKCKHGFIKISGNLQNAIAAGVHPAG
jgi:hypothetical protein